jgi:hypothetical protein
MATVPIRNAAGVIEYKTVLIGGAQASGAASSLIGAQDRDPTITSNRRPVYWYKSTDDEQ